MWQWIRMIPGVVAGLLVARLVGLLFAVRPDNPVFQVLLAITAPLVWPWTWLDRWAAQPRFGARLDLATVATILFVALVSIIWVSYRMTKRRAGARGEE